MIITQYKIPDGGLGQSQIFGLYEESTNWETINDSTFALHPEGDNLFLYCLTAEGEPHFIYGFSFFGEWDEAGLETYPVSNSALPASLEDVGSVAVEGFSNWRYAGPRTGTPAVMKEAFSIQANWIGSDLRYDMSPPGTSAAASAASTTLLGLAFFYLFLFWG
jgi:hypothetical protein